MSETNRLPFTPQGLAKTVHAAPKTVDDLVDLWAGVHEQGVLLAKLAKHYGVKLEDLEQLLIRRQITLLWLLTDRSVKGSEGSLQQLLSEQNSRLDAIMTRATSLLDQLDTALGQVKFLQDEAARVLAIQQQELAKLEEQNAGELADLIRENPAD
jgi:flagellar motility protein MotE (MotC chaperone)